MVRRTEKEMLKRFFEIKDWNKSKTAVALKMVLETHGGTVCIDESRTQIFKCMIS